ncbi:hypothetical protein HAX54_050767 [Datura stramonium]|uniref:Uncharacterized protein n=1 Tax=Datura stramonium TaxID=4076 RepID=A0ABS8WLR3_DATST|nr:hypothetical protein [Datura stramonium]
MPSMETTESPASQPLRRGPGHPLKQRSDVKEAPAVSPTPSSPLGSIVHCKFRQPQILNEESEKVIVKVESLLVKKLLTSGNDADFMVHRANITFRYLKGLGVDYGSFYRDIREHIKHCCDLQDAEREETMLSLSALQKNYENAIFSADDVGKDLGRTQGER